MILRRKFLEKISYSFEITPICALLGPRQSGKTTLALNFAKSCGQPYFHFDLENPRHEIQLREHPMLSLESLEGLIVIDETQRIPELFPILRYLVDHHQKKFLILGSASRDLLRQSSESLAGRISYLELTPLTLPEILPTSTLQKHWLYGGYPLAFLARSFARSRKWLGEYIHSFLERDLASFGITVNPAQVYQLWMQLAHYHGQIVNYSEIGSHLGLSHTKVKNYIEILSGTFMIRILRPYHANILKRQVKSPKVYIRDSGICGHFLDLTENTFLGHSRLGAYWEGYALEEILRAFGARAEFCYFWRTENGAELDLLFAHDGQIIGFEFKYADTPKMTKSMHSALQDLKLDRLHVITPKGDCYKIHEKVSVWGLAEFLTYYRECDFEGEQRLPLI